MKITVFWEMTICTRVDMNQGWGKVFYPEDGGRIFSAILVTCRLQDLMAQGRAIFKSLHIKRAYISYE
jgi:hypothetical protein